MPFIAACDRKNPEREIKTPRIAKPRRTPSTRVAELKRAVRDAERANNERNATLITTLINSFKLNSPRAGFDCAGTVMSMDQWQEQKSRERIARREAAERRTESTARAYNIGAACDPLTKRVTREFNTLDAENRAQLRARIAAKLSVNVNITEAQRELNAANFHRSRELLGLEYDPETRRTIIARMMERT